MIVCQLFLRTFTVLHRRLHLLHVHPGLSKYHYSHCGWVNFSIFPVRNLSIYHHEKQAQQADIDFPPNNDTYLFYALDSASLHYKNSLYQDSEDEIVKKLKACRFAVNVFEIIDRCESLSLQQSVQAVLTLRGFQKFLESKQESTICDCVEMFRGFQAALQSPSFNKLIQSILTLSPQMNLEELSCCILYLHKFNMPKETLLKLINTFENVLKHSKDSDITESALARVCIVFRNFNDIRSIYALKNLLPIIFKKLDLCSDVETLGRITVCFQKMVPILSTDSLLVLVEKSRELLRKSDDVEIESNRIRTILKIVLLLSFKLWRNQFFLLEKQLLMSVCGSVKYFSTVEAAVLYEVNLIFVPLATENMECHQLVHEIEQEVNMWMSCEAQNDSKRYYIASLFPKMNHSGLNNDKMLSFFTKKSYFLNDFYSDFNNFYYWLFKVGGASVKQYSNAYWKRVADYFVTAPSVMTMDRLFWICLRYLNYHQAKNYYNRDFEKQMYTFLAQIFFSEKNAILAPSDFIRLGLLIVFFQRSVSNFSEPVWNRITDNMSRLNFSENLTVSFVIKMISKRLQRSEVFSKFLPHYVNMVAALNNNSFELLSSHGESDTELLNLTLRAFHYREVVKTSPLYDCVRSRFKDITEECINAKFIQNFIVNLMNYSLLEPHLTDTMMKYCIAEKDSIRPTLLKSLLHYIFIFGYESDNIGEFVDGLTEIIIRNKMKLQGGAIIEAALAFCFYHNLPIELTDYIFNVDFLNNVECEIQQSTNRNSVRLIRQNLMELNRAVCLHYPERDIPWFHEKYCKEKQTMEANSDSSLFQFHDVLESRVNDYFFDDVSRKLGEIIPIENSVKLSCVSPYYHKIDFLIHTNRKGEPVDPDTCASSNLRKIAVQLSRNLSSSNYYRGKGAFDSMIRQLELLDYKVIVINRKIWNSMYMSEPFAKENYLSSLIWQR